MLSRTLGCQDLVNFRKVIVMNNIYRNCLCEEIDEYVSILNSFKNELINEDKNEIESKLIQSTSNRKEIE